MSQEPSKDFVRQCIGRFCVDIPQSMARMSDVFQLQYVQVEETLWQKLDDEARTHVWEKRLARIASLKEKRELPDDAQGLIREQRALSGASLQGVLFHRFGEPEIATWGGLLHRGPVDVWLQIDGDLDREEEWAKRLVEVADAYRLRDSKDSLPVRGKDWFYVRHGVVSLPMKEMEETSVRFEGHPLVIKLKISTATVEEVERQSLMDKLSQAMVMVGSHCRQTKISSPRNTRPGMSRGSPEKS